MNEIEVKAAAKINLFLKVVRKRTDGYHDIYSLFQAINLFDHLSFSRSNKEGMRLLIEDNVDLPLDEKNLVIRAATLLFERFDLSGGLEIRLKKNIPVAAGLGGGSSDAASTIYAISRLYDLNLSTENMQEIGLEIGSDVPFFFSFGQAVVTGRGELINNISLPVDYSIVLIVPPIAVSTAESYKRLNLSLTGFVDDVRFARCKDFTELVARICDIGNDFEEDHLESFPVLKEIRDVLERSGAVLTCISGSGPTMFGLHKAMPESGDFCQTIKADWGVFFVHPITLPVWG